MPIVLATGWGATIDPADARMHGIHAVLCKPYRLKGLQDVLSELPERGPHHQAA